MAPCLIAVAIKHSVAEEFLLVRQTPPPVLQEAEYRFFVDSDLWDLPSAPLKHLEREDPLEVNIEGIDAFQDKLDLRLFNVHFSLAQVASQLGIAGVNFGSWSVLKYVEEPDFGPDVPFKILFLLGRLVNFEVDFPDSCKWISIESAQNLLFGSSPSVGRVGPLAFVGLFHDYYGCRKWKLPKVLHGQEYPPGITLVPMRSRTLKPFHSTNLVVVVSEGEAIDDAELGIIKHGDALLVDPGCSSQFHLELANLVTSLPRKLVVFLTHHHYDHIDGLSVICKCNPDSVLLAHENTLSRIPKGTWSNGHVAISSGEKIQIGAQMFEAIFAPGHTDGHFSLFHLNTRSLIAGDHCVGFGSASLDVTGGGQMKDYFQTTYKLLELFPRVLVPMHGRINLWPERMLCGYLKHRRDREQAILEAIENGAKTLYDIVAAVYADVDIKLWIVASSNVRLHVDHLSYQDKLPKAFSLEKFQGSSGIRFFVWWTFLHVKRNKLVAVKTLSAVGFGGLAFYLAIKSKSCSKWMM